MLRFARTETDFSLAIHPRPDAAKEESIEEFIKFYDYNVLSCILQGMQKSP